MEDVSVQKRKRWDTFVTYKNVKGVFRLYRKLTGDGADTIVRKYTNGDTDKLTLIIRNGDCFDSGRRIGKTHELKPRDDLDTIFDITLAALKRRDTEVVATRTEENGSGNVYGLHITKVNWIKH